MGRSKNPFPPKAVKHPRDQAMRCWWNGRWWPLGPAADEAAWRAEYGRLVALWAVDPGAAARDPADYLVAELCRDYLASADAPPPGLRRSQVGAALADLCRDFGPTPVAEFGPVALRAWQTALCAERDPKNPARGRFGLRSVTQRVGVVRQVWRWAVATERVPAERHAALRAVPGPKAGEVRPPRRVEPADPAAVRAAVPFLRPPVRALVLLEWATGARPSELLGMRVGGVLRGGRVNVPGAGPQDLDALGVWAYVPPVHKTTHRGKPRWVVFGPAEQAILAPLLAGRGPDEYVFRPGDAVADLRAEQRAERAARGGGSGGSRKPAKGGRAGGRYSRDSYYRAVARACDRAGVARWFPYQLRHLAASEIKAAFDVDAVTATLGHHTRTMGEHYGGRSFAKAAEVARGRTAGG